MTRTARLARAGIAAMVLAASLVLVVNRTALLLFVIVGVLTAVAVRVLFEYRSVFQNLGIARTLGVVAGVAAAALITLVGIVHDDGPWQTSGASWPASYEARLELDPDARSGRLTEQIIIRQVDLSAIHEQLASIHADELASDEVTPTPTPRDILSALHTDLREDGWQPEPFAYGRSVITRDRKVPLETESSSVSRNVVSVAVTQALTRYGRLHPIVTSPILDTIDVELRAPRGMVESLDPPGTRQDVPAGDRYTIESEFAVSGVTVSVLTPAFRTQPLRTLTTLPRSNWVGLGVAALWAVFSGDLRTAVLWPFKQLRRRSPGPKPAARPIRDKVETSAAPRDDVPLDRGNFD